MKKTVLLLLAAALAACGQTSKSNADQIRDALPSSAALQINAPNPSGGAGATAMVTDGASRAMTADGKSDLAVSSYVLATSVNLGVGIVLAELEWLTLLPPTTCTADACTWGPGSAATDLSDWMLVVTKVGGSYDYALSARPKVGGTGFVTVIDGTATPGAAPHHGKGVLSVYFDAEATLPHPAGWTQTDFGTMTATYDATVPLQLQVVWKGTLDNDPAATPGTKANALYDFDAGARDLVVAWQTIEANPATLSLHTRWNAAGAGRADFQMAQNPATVTKSECWNGAAAQYAQVYDSYDSATLLPVGDPALCAFQDQAVVSPLDFSKL